MCERLDEAVVNSKWQHSKLTIIPKFPLVDEDVTESQGDPIVWSAYQIGVREIVVPPSLVSRQSHGRLRTFMFKMRPPCLHLREANAQLLNADRAHAINIGSDERLRDGPIVSSRLQSLISPFVAAVR